MKLSQSKPREGRFAHHRIRVTPHAPPCPHHQRDPIPAKHRHIYSSFLNIITIYYQCNNDCTCSTRDISLWCHWSRHPRVTLSGRGGGAKGRLGAHPPRRAGGAGQAAVSLMLRVRAQLGLWVARVCLFGHKITAKLKVGHVDMEEEGLIEFSANWRCSSTLLPEKKKSVPIPTAS